MSTSDSTKIIEFLKTVESEKDFTSTTIINSLPGVSKGAITGLLAKLKKDGLIRQVGSEGKSIIYAINGDLSEYRTRNVFSPGGTKGRTINGVSRKQRLVNSLLSIASEIELLRGDITDFSTKELLHEVERRMKNGD